MKKVNIYGPNDFRLDDVENPAADNGDVIIAIEACGICGSDLKYVVNGGTLFSSATPMGLGHEFCGVITEPGASSLKKGQRVVVNPARALSYGAIGNGGPDGAFAEFLRVSANDVDGGIIPIPDILSTETAALAEPLSVGLHAVNRSQVKQGQRVVVMGVGCIGQGILAGLQARGISDVIAVDVSPTRLEAAKRLGARECLQADQDDIFDKLKTLHGSEMALGLLPAVGTEIYFDTTASAKVLQDTIKMARQGAVIVYVGIYNEDVSLDLVEALHREVDLRASVAYENEFEEAIDLLSNSDIDFQAMISHRFPLENFSEAFATAKNSQISNKVMVTVSHSV